MRHGISNDNAVSRRSSAGRTGSFRRALGMLLSIAAGIAGCAVADSVSWITGSSAAASVNDAYAYRQSVYFSDVDPLVQVPGSSNSVWAGVLNPAAWPVAQRGGIYLGWDQTEEDYDVFRGAFSLGSLGFSVRQRMHADTDQSQYRYSVGGGFGDQARAVGFSYSWVRGGRAVFPGEEEFRLGSIHRSRRFSLGFTRTWNSGGLDDVTQADFGFRPFGPRLTLFADAFKFDNEDWDELAYGFGAEAHIVPGVTVAGRYVVADENGFDDDPWSARIEISPLAGIRAAFTHQDGAERHRLAVADGNIKETAQSWSVELRPGHHLGQLFPPSSGHYPGLDLRGPKPYRTYRFLDGRTRFASILARIAYYAENPTVEGLTVNMAGLRLSGSGLWELRSQLAAFRARGKKVVLYFDRVNMPGYMLATVADEIWMDPIGDLDLKGLHAGRSFYKESLAKSGIGFDEVRFFTYKSALETLSRTSLSEASKVQIGALLDDIYEEIVSHVVTSRGIPRSTWDQVVNDYGMLSAEEALELGLIDKIGSYAQAEEGARDAARRETPDAATAYLGTIFGDPIWAAEEWGARSRIAVLYAVGPTSMESGIEGRKLSQAIKDAREDRSVKAVVFRADSPGGDPLPSDWVARELKKTSEVKPVIVTQGRVAASGGYWISMYGDEILASPMTITGSIGVIYGHIWDDGIGEKMGVDYDGISRGRSADVLSGPRDPFLGIQIPHRPMHPEERDRVETLIRSLYDGFLESVADGRGMEPSEVDAIGQGRVWSGRAGVANGLVDEIGGLWDALARAKDAAGIDPAQAVRVEEGPELGWFRTSGLLPSLPGLRGLWQRDPIRDWTRSSYRSFFGDGIPSPGGSQDEESADGTGPFTAGETEYLQTLLDGTRQRPMVLTPLYLIPNWEALD